MGSTAACTLHHHYFLAHPLQDADDKQQQQEPQQQLPSQQPQQQQQDAYTDLDLAVDVAQLNARLRSGDFKRWWQDLRPPLVFSLGQKQYGPAGQCVVTSINAFLEAEAWQYNAAGLLSGRRQRLSDLLGIRSRQVRLLDLAPCLQDLTVTMTI
jgi:hypothetical protein